MAVRQEENQKQITQLPNLLAVIVQGRGGLIQQQNFWRLDKSSCNSDTLALQGNLKRRKKKGNMECCESADFHDLTTSTRT